MIAKHYILCRFVEFSREAFVLSLAQCVHYTITFERESTGECTNPRMDEQYGQSPLVGTCRKGHFHEVDSRAIRPKKFGTYKMSP